MPLREHFPIINWTTRLIMLADFVPRPRPKPANDNGGPAAVDQTRDNDRDAKEPQ
jgi:hypothetical protein